MRLTVGPLPPAVYWRRRAIVLGALVAVVALFVVRCGSDPSGAKDNTAGRTSPPPSTSASLQRPIVASQAGPSGTSTPTGSAPTGQQAAPPGGAAAGPCTDAEIVVTAATEGNKSEYVVGTPVKLLLSIKNISARSCSRDVGAAKQELRITQSNQKMWSSDDCAPSGGSAIRTFAANETVDDFGVTWYGHSSNDCQNTPLPQPGEYQLVGRVDTKWSEPVKIVLKPGK